MPFADNSFDIVINVESPLNYSNFSAFLREVDRVLKPGGTFLFADYRRSGKMVKLRQSLTGMDYDIEHMTDITPGIVRGLEFGVERKRALIDRHVAWHYVVSFEASPAFPVDRMKSGMSFMRA